MSNKGVHTIRVDLLQEMHRASRQFDRHFKAALSELQLNRREAEAMLAIANAKHAPSLSDIADAMDASVSPSTVLKKLRNETLVKQIQDDSDERVRRFQLTSRGRGLVSQIEERRDDVVGTLAAGLSASELRTALSLIRALG